jgi:hypothetical protein
MSKHSGRDNHMIQCKSCKCYEQRDNRLFDKDFCFSCAEDYINAHLQNINSLLDSVRPHERQEESNNVQGEKG